jgi:glycosyltransferase involved in cell wall biosynthesis
LEALSTKAIAQLSPDRPIGPKPRVCFLRGSYLNPFETQYLTPLQAEFDIVAAHPRSHRYDVEDCGVPCVSVPCLDYLNGLIPRTIGHRAVPNPLKTFGFEEVLIGVERLVKAYDVVHVPEQTFFFTWQVAKKKRRTGIRMVTTQCEVNPYWYQDRSVIAARARLVREETDLFLARSERARLALLLEGVEPQRVRVVGHGVDTTRFHPGDRDAQLSRTLGIDADRFVILFVGRLVWTKGLFALADAAALLLRDPAIRRLDPLFLIVGGGPERPGFEARLRQLGVAGSFRLAGARGYDVLPDIHRLANMLVLPSISTRFILEQFGIVLIEAMATGVPIVTTHCGAIDEVVGDAGVLVQPNDSRRLSEAMLRLCRDVALRAELGERGLERVRARMTREVVADALASAYQDVLDR